MKTPKQSNKFMFFYLIYLEALPFIIALILRPLKMLGVIDQALFDTINTNVSLYGELLTMLLPIIFLIAVKGIPFRELVPVKRISLKNVTAIIIMTLLFMPTISLFSSAANFFAENDVNTELINLAFDMNAGAAILSFAVMPAVFEELVFRGVVLTGFKKANMIKAAAAAGLFFGMMHMDFFQLTYTVIAGLVFGIFVYCTNSIFAGMIGHFVLNGLQIVGQILYFKLGDPEEVRASLSQVMTFQDKINLLVISAVSAVITLPIFILLVKRFIRKNKSNVLEYKYGTDDESINTETAADEADCKIIDKFFVMTVLLYLAEMAVKPYLFK